MTSILISLLLILTLCTPLLAQLPPPACPSGSSLRTSTTTFTVYSPPSKLQPLLDFYSPTWHLLLDLHPELTFSPPIRTLSYPTLTLTETPLSLPDIDIAWTLSSTQFTPPGSPDTKIASYTHYLQLRPLCPGDTHSALTWTTHFCISSSSTTNWFADMHHDAAEYIFANIAPGGFDSGDGCDPVPTTTLFATYPGVLGLGTTLPWGTGSSVVRPVAVETGEVGKGTVETYKAVSGTGGKVVDWVVGSVVAWAVGLVVL